MKRVRGTGRVRVQGSDLRGKVVHGPVHEGTARLLDADASARVARATAHKYGLLGRLTVAGSRLRRGRTGTVGIPLDLQPVTEG